MSPICWSKPGLQGSIEGRQQGVVARGRVHQMKIRDLLVPHHDGRVHVSAGESGVGQISEGRGDGSQGAGDGQQAVQAALPRGR